MFSVMASFPLLQVADWVSNIGMDQYRRSFVHHAIDGILLGHLTPEQLRVYCLAALPSYC